MPANLELINQLLSDCSPEERAAVFAHLRRQFSIHAIEDEWNVEAEVILEAIHRAPDITQRGVRGVIAEACFELHVVRQLPGWSSEDLHGKTSYDFLLSDVVGSVRVEVKMQRLECKRPKVAKKEWQRAGELMYVVETQRTRGGTSAEGEPTRPYRFGDFDVLAVSMHPSTRDWCNFHYTVADWLVPKDGHPERINTFQPVPGKPDEESWTTDFLAAVKWFRSGEQRRIWVPPTVEDPMNI